MIEQVDRHGTNSAKYSKRALENLCGNPEAEPFWVADMDFASPIEAKEALISTAKLGLYGYPAFQDLEQVFINWVQKRHSCTLDKSNVVISPGILASIAAITELYPNRDIIIPRPAYKPFVDIAKNHERKIHDWPLFYDKEKQTFSLDFNLLEEIATTPGKKMLFFCSPHNPSGRVWTKEELEKVAQICQKHDIVILSDEIHCDLTFLSYHHTPFFEITKDKSIDSIVFMAPSKTFNIAGEHFSATVFTNEKLAQKFKTYLEKMRISEIALLSGTAAVACYEHGYNWLMELTQYLEDNTKLIRDFLNRELPEIKFIMPQASFVTFLDCSQVRTMLQKANITDDLCHFFGKQASVAMNAGPWFGSGYDDFLRFNYGTDSYHIIEALKRMKKAVDSLKR